MFARLPFFHRSVLCWLAGALLVLSWPAGTALAAPSPSPSPTPVSSPAPTARPILGPRGTLVAFSNQEPWLAELSGFEPDRVQSVTYFVRDAGQHWHRIGPITSAPFTAELEWWTWDDAGQVVVTSHVQSDGNETTDPGGWTTVDGQSVNPRGRLETLANSDGSLGARYTPDQGAARIELVQFWLRVGGQWSEVADVSQPGASGSFDAPFIDGTGTGSWKSDDTAMSVHVVWSGGRQWVDPAPWAWRDHFVATTVSTPAPVAVATPVPTATPTPPPTAAPVAAAPTAAAPPAPAPPTQPPAAPPGCYPLTNAGNCYQPGEYCRNSDHGKTGRTASGEAIVCAYNNGWRWEPA